MPNTAQLAELESLLETLVALVKETEALETLLVERLDRFHAAERASEELGAESFDSADFDFDIEDIYSFDESFAGGTPESPVTGALSSDDVEPAVPEPVAATVDPDPAAQGSDPVPATDGAPSTRASVSSASGAPSPRDSVSSASGDPSLRDSVSSASGDPSLRDSVSSASGDPSLRDSVSSSTGAPSTRDSVSSAAGDPSMRDPVETSDAAAAASSPEPSPSTPAAPPARKMTASTVFKAATASTKLYRGRGKLLKKIDAELEDLDGVELDKLSPAQRKTFDSLTVNISVWLTKHQRYQNLDADRKTRFRSIYETFEEARKGAEQVDVVPAGTGTAVSPRPEAKVQLDRWLGVKQEARTALVDAVSEPLREGIDVANEAIDVTRIQEATKNNESYWEVMAADTQFSELASGSSDMLSSVVQGVSAGQDLFQGTATNETERAAFAERRAVAGRNLVQAVGSGLEGAMGVGGGDAVGVGNLGVEVAGELTGVVTDGFAAVHHGIEARKASKARTAAAATGKKVEKSRAKEFERLRARVEPMYLRDYAVLEELCRDGLNILDAQSTGKVVLPSLGEISLAEARHRFAELRADARFMAYMEAGRAANALDETTARLLTKLVASTASATAAGVSAVGTLTAGVDLGTVKVVGAVLKGGVFLGRLRVRGSRKAQGVDEVEHLKHMLGKANTDNPFERVRKILKPGGVAKSTERINKQYDAVQRLVSGLGDTEALTATAVLHAWQHDRCEPQSDAANRAQKVAELFNPQAGGRMAPDDESDYKVQEIEALLARQEDRVALAIFDIAVGLVPSSPDVRQEAIKLLDAISAPVGHIDMENTSAAQLKPILTAARHVVVQQFQRAWNV